MIHRQQLPLFVCPHPYHHPPMWFPLRDSMGYGKTDDGVGPDKVRRWRYGGDVTVEVGLGDVNQALWMRVTITGPLASVCDSRGVWVGPLAPRHEVERVRVLTTTFAPQ